MLLKRLLRPGAACALALVFSLSAHAQAITHGAKVSDTSDITPVVGYYYDREGIGTKTYQSVRSDIKGGWKLVRAWTFLAFKSNKTKMPPGVTLRPIYQYSAPVSRIGGDKFMLKRRSDIRRGWKVIKDGNGNPKPLFYLADKPFPGSVPIQTWYHDYEQLALVEHYTATTSTSVGWKKGRILGYGSQPT